MSFTLNIHYSDKEIIMAFTNAKTVADEKAAVKNQAKAFISWELVNADGSELLREDGSPLLRSDKDIPLWQNKLYPSVAEDQLIALAQGSEEGYIELTLRVKVKNYIPKEKTSTEELFAALGIRRAA